MRRLFAPSVIVFAAATALAAMSIFGRRHRSTNQEAAGGAQDSDGQVTHIDARAWNVEPLTADFDLAAFRRRMPALDPPLSATVIEDREAAEG